MNAEGCLPEGVTARPIGDEDVDAVVALVNDCERHDAGRVMMERADLISDMGAGGFDRERDTVLVVEGGRPIAWGLVAHRRTRWADVRPDDRGRGVGTWLMRWSERRARELGSDRIGQSIDDVRTEVASMFLAAGYTRRHTSWILRKDHPDPPGPPQLPEVVTIRAFRPEDETEALTMFEEAFSEFDDRLPSSLETWRAMTTRREGFVPDDLVLAVAQDRIVGGAFLIDSEEIWVDKLAVHRDHRHRGIARALLQVAFQRSHARGYRQTRLSTDSRTGALGAYERVGMRVVESFTHYALDL
jgi:GNAT superfamily N-acetyltransferase